jgi:pyruvate,water dikinase
MYVIRPEELRDIPECDLGGKASNLARLAKAGFPVPKWFAASTSAYRAAREPGRADQVLLELTAAYEAEFRRDSAYVPVAVRSSAVGEDGSASSFAGQMKTFLYVDGPEAFKAAVAGCWESAAAPGIAAYRASQGLPADGFEVAVVVQEMVASEVSGVLFTANPATGDRDEMVVRAAYGLGEGVVADLVETDGYFVKDGAVRSEVESKLSRVVRDPETGRGTKVVPVPEAIRESPCLSESQVRDLAGMATRVAQARPSPPHLAM